MRASQAVEQWDIFEVELAGSGGFSRDAGDAGDNSFFFLRARPCPYPLHPLHPC